MFDNQAVNNDVIISSANKWRIVRANRNIGQTLLAGMPQFEARVSASNAVSVTFNVSFKTFFNFLTPIEHPLYERAIYSSYIDGARQQLELYRSHIGSHSGEGISPVAAIRDSKTLSASQWPDEPQLNVLNHPGLIPQNGIIYPRAGITASVRHSSPDFMDTVLGGLKPLMAKNSKDLGWLHKNRIRSKRQRDT